MEEFMKCFISREYDVSLDILNAIQEVLNEMKIEYFDMYSGQVGMNIATSVLNAIKESQIVIAIVTQKASNVLFEIGMAIGAGKAVFLLIDDNANIPTDLKGMTYIKINENLKENLLLPLNFLVESKRKIQKIDLANTYKSAIINISKDMYMEKFKDIKNNGSGVEFEKLVVELFEELKGQYAALKFTNVTREAGYDLAVWIDELENKIVNPVKFELKYGNISRKQLDECIRKLASISKNQELIFVLYYSKKSNIIDYHSGVPNIVVVEFENFVDKVFEYGLAQAIWYFRNLGAHGRSCENASL